MGTLPLLLFTVILITVTGQLYGPSQPIQQQQPQQRGFSGQQGQQQLRNNPFAPQHDSAYNPNVGSPSNQLRMHQGQSGINSRQVHPTNPLFPGQQNNQFGQQQSPQQQQQQQHQQQQSNPLTQPNAQQQHTIQNQFNALNAQRQQNQRPNQQSNLRQYDPNSQGNNQNLAINTNNVPGIFINPTRSSSRMSTGASLTIQLSNYLNPNKAMKDGKTCYCSREECTILENVLHQCYFTFTIVISQAGGEPAYYLPKYFVSIGSDGRPVEKGDWSAEAIIPLSAKPTTIDIFVNNLGPVINQKTVIYLNEFWLVDVFSIDLSDYTPSLSNQQVASVSKSVTGSLVRSSMDVTFSVQCQAGFNGPDCDLACKPVRSSPPRAVCTSRLTNVSSVCGFDTTRNFVQNCTVCGAGLNNDVCNELAGITEREFGVNKAYKVWTIVLGVVAGVLLLFCLIMLVLYVIALRKRTNKTEIRERQRIYQQQRGALDHRPIVSSPLLNSEWQANPPHVIQKQQRGPLVDTDSLQSDGLHGTPIVNYNQAPRREAQV